MGVGGYHEYCYLCGKSYAEAKKTQEHIIQQSIGGLKHPPFYICKDCNNERLREIDTELANQFAGAMYFLRAYKERTKYAPFFVHSLETGEKLKFDPSKGYSIKPVFREKVSEEGDVTNLLIGASDERRLEEMIQNCVKKGKISEEDVAEGKRYIKPVEFKKRSLKFDIFSENIYRAVLKIAANLYVMHGGALSKPLVKFILEGGKNEYIFPALPDMFLFEDDCLCSHRIEIVCDKKSKSSIGYIELFSGFRFISILSEDYSGEDRKIRYGVDIIKGERIDNCSLTKSCEGLSFVKSYILNGKITLEDYQGSFYPFLDAIEYVAERESVSDKFREKLRSLPDDMGMKEKFKLAFEHTQTDLFKFFSGTNFDGSE